MPFSSQLTIVSALLFTLVLGACSTTPTNVDRVRDCLVGSFDSSAQAAEDPEYRVIDLHMAECWTDRSDGPWLYVEQAMAEKPESPYRQRVYHLVALEDERVRSDVYELPGPAEEVMKLFAGEWKKPQPLDDVSPDDLLLRDGCSIFLTRQPDGSFMGSTGPASCPSTLRGAAYATSEVVMTNDTLRSWDRGYNKSGQQVWGATKGAYVFVKKGAR
jgi:CpeT protein